MNYILGFCLSLKLFVKKCLNSVEEIRNLEKRKPQIKPKISSNVTLEVTNAKLDVFLSLKDTIREVDGDLGCYVIIVLIVGKV